MLAHCTHMGYLQCQAWSCLACAVNRLTGARMARVRLFGGGMITSLLSPALCMSARCEVSLALSVVVVAPSTRWLPVPWRAHGSAVFSGAFAVGDRPRGGVVDRCGAGQVPRWCDLGSAWGSTMCLPLLCVCVAYRRLIIYCFWSYGVCVFVVGLFHTRHFLPNLHSL